MDSIIAWITEQPYWMGFIVLMVIALWNNYRFNKKLGDYYLYRGNVVHKDDMPEGEIERNARRKK
jgi:hypothetical protein